MMDKEPLIVHCGDCKHEWAAAFLPMDIGLFAKVTKTARCPMCGSANAFIGPAPKPTELGDAMAWLANGDTGMSSETIWSVFTGCPVRRTGVPLDPADFGRCYRLLKIMPAWRGRLPEVASRHPEWGALVDIWDELTALYEEELPQGRCPKLYDRMQRAVAR